MERKMRVELLCLKGGIWDGTMESIEELGGFD